MQLFLQLIHIKLMSKDTKSQDRLEKEKKKISEYLKMTIPYNFLNSFIQV